MAHILVEAQACMHADAQWERSQACWGCCNTLTQLLATYCPIHHTNLASIDLP